MRDKLSTHRCEGREEGRVLLWGERGDRKKKEDQDEENGGEGID